MKPLVDVAVPITTFLLLLAVGLELTVDDFVRVRRQRALVLVGLFAPLILLPPLAVVLTDIFEASSQITAGVLLISACPIGSVSNAYCYMARAATALSVTLTGLSSLAAGITVPLVGKGFELALARPFELKVPLLLLAVQLISLLVLPVAIGMLARHRWGDRTAGLSAPLQRLAVFGVLFVFVLVILSDWDAFVTELSTTVPLATAFVIASTAVGWFTAAVVTADPRSRFAIAAGFGARNVGVATAIAVTILGQVAFARFAAIYAFVELPLLLAAVALFRAVASVSAEPTTNHRGHAAPADRRPPKISEDA